MIKQRYIYLAIATVASLLSLFLYRGANPLIQQIDLRLKDVRFRLRGPIKPDPRVVVVAIDNKSIKEVGRWPWSREVTAQLIGNLKGYGTKVIALDIVFAEPQAPRPDKILAGTIARSGNVIMGYFFRDDLQTTSKELVDQLATARVKQLKLEPGVDSIPIPGFPYFDASIPQIGGQGVDQGYFNVMPDDDGLYRNAPLLILYDGAVYASLPVKALSHYLEVEPLVEVSTFGIRTLALGDLVLPVTVAGGLPLNYYGPSNSFVTISAVDVIKKRVDPALLKNSVAFVGATEIGISDIRATPFDPALPGVEIHATVTANAMEQRFLLHDNRIIAFELLAIVLLPFLLALLLRRASGTLTGLLSFSLLVGLYAVTNFFLFKYLSWDMSIVFPLAPLLISYTASEAYRNLVIERKGRYLKMAFGSYVSPELVEEIVNNPDRLKLGGEKREITILFSDIRSFTTISESLQPEELVKLLNDYLSPMTRIVLEERGTLDKYIGDAVMAIFNAPLDVPGHAEHACHAAFKMLEKLAELNRQFASAGLPNIDIGIGINTGEAIVGNMGADIRFDYTAIGDNVNLASRLEGLNKYYGTRILVSAATKSRAGEGFFFREVDLVRVKGKKEPVAVYELLTTNQEIAARFVEALVLYRSCRFAEARSIFGELSESCGDRLSALYLGRCDEFIATPPPEDWDGVYSSHTK
jgi:adenylate cyclase